MNNDLENLKYLLTDIIEGDTDLLSRPEFRYFTMDNIRQALYFLINNPKLDEKEKAYLISNSWRINYRSKPPTPEEFITEKYIGPSALHTYDRVKQAFIDFLDPSKPYRHLILYTFIGYGKSYLSTLITLYLGTHLSLMRNPYKYFGLNPASIITQVLISYSLKKSSELLLEPLIAVLEASPFFEKIHTREGMIRRDREFERKENVDKIYWTTAVPTSAIQLSNGANVKLASSPHSLLGLAQPLDSKIQKPDGSWTTMGEIKIGDKIKSPSEGETEVTGVFPQGKIACYKITLSDGRSTKCSLNHLWKVAWEKDEKNNWIWKIVTTEFILNHPEIEFEIFDEIIKHG